MKNRKVYLGTTTITLGINTRMMEDTEFAIFVIDSLKRHSDCDWGDIENENKMLNDEAFKTGSRIISRYQYNDNTFISIVTEPGNSKTTIHFPGEII